jgi:hypothetical protein
MKYLTAVVDSADPSRTYSKQVQARWHVFVLNSFIRTDIVLMVQYGFRVRSAYRKGTKPLTV